MHNANTHLPKSQTLPHANLVKSLYMLTVIRRETKIKFQKTSHHTSFAEKTSKTTDVRP